MNDETNKKNGPQQLMRAPKGIVTSIASTDVAMTVFRHAAPTTSNVLIRTTQYGKTCSFVRCCFFVVWGFFSIAIEFGDMNETGWVRAWFTTFNLIIGTASSACMC
jgi:hypothetical protein